ncbi:hypothetical protein KSF_083980 [Reticulibacter mediterranei]|uniref:DUF3784 domain-containing protein n=1 Tax=Reticulibacter mediterranei TaxID=2778369 RepID=A0A8J3N7D4_9CHLR|nr:hypothetical protein [Reticulibacter mediterranei]GHO98350.1 hypothetical protein KSF_083980 [Reticulibacter mediterranei]
MDTQTLAVITWSTFALNIIAILCAVIGTLYTRSTYKVQVRGVYLQELQLQQPESIDATGKRGNTLLKGAGKLILLLFILSTLVSTLLTQTTSSLKSVQDVIPLFAWIIADLLIIFFIVITIGWSIAYKKGYKRGYNDASSANETERW